jgi:hypothetical protein
MTRLQWIYIIIGLLVALSMLLAVCGGPGGAAPSP